MKSAIPPDDDLELLLGNPPAVKDNGFTDRVQSRLHDRARQRILVFMSTAVLWLALFLGLSPRLNLGNGLEQLRLLGSHIEALATSLVDPGVQSLFSSLPTLSALTQPGALAGILILLAALYALLSSQLDNI